MDEEALVRALRAGHLAGAALDIFAQEPLPLNSPLWDEPGLLLTAHIAGNSLRYEDRATDFFLEKPAQVPSGTGLDQRLRFGERLMTRGPNLRSLTVHRSLRTENRAVSRRSWRAALPRYTSGLNSGDKSPEGLISQCPDGPQGMVRRQPARPHPRRSTLEPVGLGVPRTGEHPKMVCQYIIPEEPRIQREQQFSRSLLWNKNVNFPNGHCKQIYALSESPITHHLWCLDKSKACPGLLTVCETVRRPRPLLGP